MIKALNTAATGMASQEVNVNTIANNIANVNTTGFKKSRAEFEDLLYETIKEPGARSSDDTEYNVGVQIGSGSKVSSTRKIISQGNPNLTKNPFDLMINGDGFFGILMPNNQIGYTRNGAFNVDKNGVIVDKKGNTLFPGLNVPPNTTNVNIAQDGKIEAYVSGQVQPTVVGTVPVFTFVNPVGLKAIGQNLLVESNASGPATQLVAGQDHAGVLMQGALETSNVSVMNEMTDLIKAQRAYEMNSKVMNIADQMLGTINQVR
jgi:flagellar basal-body rod protein FlgG